MTDEPNEPLRGISDTERQIMGRLLRQSPEQQKAAPKPAGPQAEAQRRRRQKERETTGAARVAL
jgi:hypothetical protein